MRASPRVRAGAAPAVRCASTTSTARCSRCAWRGDRRAGGEDLHRRGEQLVVGGADGGPHELLGDVRARDGMRPDAALGGLDEPDGEGRARPEQAEAGRSSRSRRLRARGRAPRRTCRGAWRCASPAWARCLAASMSAEVDGARRARAGAGRAYAAQMLAGRAPVPLDGAGAHVADVLFGVRRAGPVVGRARLRPAEPPDRRARRGAARGVGAGAARPGDDGLRRPDDTTTSTVTFLFHELARNLRAARPRRQRALDPALA